MPYTVELHSESKIVHDGLNITQWLAQYTYHNPNKAEDCHDRINGADKEPNIYSCFWKDTHKSEIPDTFLQQALGPVL